jgi:hypothetical protein
MIAVADSACGMLCAASPCVAGRACAAFKPQENPLLSACREPANYLAAEHTDAINTLASSPPPDHPHPPPHPPLTTRRKPANYLAGEHTDAINTLAFSPNGVYLATGGLDKQVVVWLAERGVAVAKTTLEEVRLRLAGGMFARVGPGRHVPGERAGRPAICMAEVSLLALTPLPLLSPALPLLY